MVYVTHDQVEAMTLGDRVVVLDRGKVQQVGRPLDLYERPANRFVAGFLGWPPMNFFDGRLVRRPAGEWVLATNGRELPLSTETFTPLPDYNGAEVTAGIRPEHVIVSEGIAPSLGMMDVLLVEPLGATTLVTLGRDGRQLLAVVGRGAALRERQTVEVGLGVRHLQLFDRTNGSALPRGVLSG
jgi:multiple sugar transport system ATP-binding protein